LAGRQEEKGREEAIDKALCLFNRLAQTLQRMFLLARRLGHLITLVLGVAAEKTPQMPFPQADLRQSGHQFHGLC
jgi:hypothetical protein